MPTREELTQQLDALEASLPGMIKANPDPSDFWLAFAGEADVIEDAAGEQTTYVHARIDEMLIKHDRILIRAGEE